MQGGCLVHGGHDVPPRLRWLQIKADSWRLSARSYAVQLQWLTVPGDACRRPPDSTAPRVHPIATDSVAAHTQDRTVPLSQEIAMLHYAVIFFVIALIAAVFGFGGIAAGAAGIAKILFFVFVIMAVVTFVVSLANKR
jgi:uncharacterized membrane protein YtjA (UPF0391 family)